MSGKRLLKRLVTVMLMTVGFLILLMVVRVEAMPIRPDIKKLLAQPRMPIADFEPARAGWNGPESPKLQTLNSTYEQFGPAATERAVKSSIMAAALPDYRLLAAILLVILLLRRMRKAQKTARVAAPTPAAPPAEPEITEQIERAA